jgi:NTE family protein
MARDVDYLLIGGGMSSAIAAEVLRSESISHETVTIISAENILPYFRPVLPKMFLMGDIKQEKALIFQPEFYQENDIEMLLGTKALSVDPKNKIVKTDKAGDLHFKKLLIATGCYPKLLKVKGSDLAGIHYLHNFNDAQAVLSDMKDAKKAVILGGNYVSIELASTLIKKGMHVTIIADNFILFNAHPFVDPKPYLEKQGVEVIIADAVKKFNGKQHVQSLETASGKTVPCDLVVITEHNEPAVDFLRDSGIKIDDGIVVNQYLETNFADIYAAGDAARFYNPVFKKYRRIEGTDHAAKQGKIAALNMLGGRACFRAVSYFFFSAFETSFVLLGDSTDTDEMIMRGTVTDKNFASLGLKDGILKSVFICGRPIAEIKAFESLIANRINLSSHKKKVVDTAFPLEPLAVQTVLTLQGGGALGAFECGVVTAMEECQIYPDIVAGISIGAFNSAIIASNPKNAANALDAFWDELAVNTLPMPDEQIRRLLSSWQSICWGLPKFFYPRWFMPIENFSQLPMNWTSYYDPSFIKKLLCKYVDFQKLKESPVRLLVMAVNIETAEFETFDSYTEEITPDHILASGSLPPGFPWTTIHGKHYWDGGIVSNTPLDSMFEICGSSGKNVYIVELYPRLRSLPQNMLDVVTRKDEIVFSEKIRKDVRGREIQHKYRRLVDVILKLSSSEVADEIRRLPIYIQVMGDPGLVSTTRIVREMRKNEPYSWDSDFSKETIAQHKERGYETAIKTLKEKGGK